MKRKTSKKVGFLKVVGLVVILGGVGYIVSQTGHTETFDRNEDTKSVATTTEVVVVEEVDMLDSAKAELDAINRQLDEEEMRLVAEKEAIDVRLNQIHEIRLSF